MNVEIEVAIIYSTSYQPASQKEKKEKKKSGKPDTNGFVSSKTSFVSFYFQKWSEMHAPKIARGKEYGFVVDISRVSKFHAFSSYEDTGISQTAELTPEKPLFIKKKWCQLSVEFHFPIENINKGLHYWPSFQKIIANNVSILHTVFF